MTPAPQACVRVSYQYVAMEEIFEISGEAQKIPPGIKSLNSENR
jgi:hypothetical protein